MKKYIMPITDIEKTTLSISILEPSKPQAVDSISESEQLGNGVLFDKMDDAYPPKGDGLWDDADD